MSNNSLLHGVLPIVQTPFRQDLSIDWDTLRGEVEWAITHGVNGIGTGMVSESRSMSPDERHQYAEKLVEFVDSRCPVFLSITADDCASSMQLARDLSSVGCDALMAAPPIIEKLDSQGILLFYSQLAESVDLMLIVQDASGYLGNAIPHEVYHRLLERFGHDKIVFKPEAPPNGPMLSALRDATEGQAKMYEGSGGIYLIDSMRRGVVGTMPGMELVDGMLAVWQAMKRGDEETAYRIHFPLSSIVALQLQAGLDGFLAIEKYLLHKRGVFPNEIRREPIRWLLDQETAQEVDRLFARFEEAMQFD